MGEASGGRSATSPTFFKSTSVRTRMEWQNSQVVWTALDQRNFTGAPQLGQFAAGVIDSGLSRKTWWRTHSCVPCSHSGEHVFAWAAEGVHTSVCATS